MPNAHSHSLFVGVNIFPKVIYTYIYAYIISVCVFKELFAIPIDFSTNRNCLFTCTIHTYLHMYAFIGIYLSSPFALFRNSQSAIET